MPLSFPGAESNSIRRARPLLGTRVEIAVSDACEERCLHGVVDEAFGCIEAIHRLMSYQEPDSDVARLNRLAPHHPVTVHPHTYRVCEAALQFARESEGAFDPTVAGRLERWGLLPSNGGSWDAGASWRDIELGSDGQICFKRRLRLDLSGIAKGYAVDLAVELLRNRVANAVVNAGGDLRAVGAVPQSVHLRHPQAPLRSAHCISIQNAALATSGGYFSRQTGPAGEVCALVEARSGKPYLGSCSVSVRAADCMSADALTKVVLFAAPGLAERCLAAHQAQGYLLDPA